MSHKLTTEQFIEKATKVHGSRYGYEKTVYTSAQSKIIVECRIHGDFEIRPDSHANGAKSGCAKCKFDKLHNLIRETQEGFLSKACEKHGDKFDYSQVVYARNISKVSIGCKLHGFFDQTPNAHLAGQGCPRCKTTGYRHNKPGWLYVFVADNITKVGITNRSVETRRKEIQRHSGLKFETVYSEHFSDGAKAQAIETVLLNQLKAAHKQPQDIFNGSTECFVDVDLDGLIRTIHLTTTA